MQQPQKIKVNPSLASFLRFILLGYHKVGSTVWTTLPDGSKALTKTQLLSLENKGLIVIDWYPDKAVLESHVNIIGVDPIGKVPYKNFNVLYH